MTEPPAIGELVTVDVQSPVTGGRCIARHQGRIVFVRGALPGERVVARVTGHGRKGAFVWAEVEQVAVASAQRVKPPCRVAGVCGGCDWQHGSLAEQRRIKASVIADALRRTGGLTSIDGIALNEAVQVKAVDDGNGLGWRTRMRYAVDDRRRVGLRAHESHEIVEAADCPLAVIAIQDVMSRSGNWPANSEIIVAASSAGDLWVSGLTGTDLMVETVLHRTWTIPVGAFWQVHPRAATELVEAVLAMAEPRPGELVLDLYSGVGLFAAFLAERVGETGQLHAVERDAAAVDAGRANLVDLGQVRYHRASVAAWLGRRGGRPADVVVLDPPRAGAGRSVVAEIAACHPRAIVYVACDPVALARDTKTLAALDYSLRDLRCFDIFPMTKHVECVALFTPTSQPAPPP